MSLKTLFIAGIAAASIAAAGSCPAKAANVAVEAVSGENIGTLDTKVSGTLPGNVGYFCRNRTSVDYDADNNTSGFSLVDLTYPLGLGFDVVAENQFPDGASFDPRLGVQYFHDLDNGLTFYAMVTRDFNENPNTELTIVLGYIGDINGKLKLTGRWEQIENMGDKSYNYDLTRLRLGIGNDNITIGPALDISGVGSGARPTYAPGGFVQVKVN